MRRLSSFVFGLAFVAGCGGTGNSPSVDMAVADMASSRDLAKLPDLSPPPEDLSVGWVATIADVPLWADPDASLFLGLAPPYTAFKQLEPQNGPRLHVQDLYSGAESWLDALNVGPIDGPGQISAPSRWWGPTRRVRFSPPCRAGSGVVPPKP